MVMFNFIDQRNKVTYSVLNSLDCLNCGITFDLAQAFFELFSLVCLVNLYISDYPDSNLVQPLTYLLEFIKDSIDLSKIIGHLAFGRTRGKVLKPDSQHNVAQ